jgi:helix-turn-helix protein
MATQSSAWTGEKPRKAGNGAGRGSAARSGEIGGSISPTGSAQEGIAREDQATLAPGNSNVAKTCVPRLPTKRAAYSPAEFAASCGRHPSWAYRLLYGGKIRAITDLGRILIPASELERVLSSATPYNPQPRKSKSQQCSETVGGDA